MGKGNRSQRKGRIGELELAEVLRGLGFSGVHASPPMQFGHAPDLVGLPGIHIECKRHERLELPSWLRQAAADAERFGDGLPAVFFRRNRGEWSVVMTLQDWAALYRKGETT